MKRARVVALAAAALLATFASLRADDDSAPQSPPPAVTDPAQVAQHYREVTSRPEFADAQDSSANPRMEDLLSEWFQNLGKRIGDFKYASRMPAFASLLMSVLVAFSLAIVVYIVLRLTRGHRWMWRENESPKIGRASCRERV